MSDKEVKIRITGDVSDLQKKLKSIEDSLNDLGKGNTGNNKFVNSLIDDIGKADKKIDELDDSLDDMSDSFRKLGKNSSLDEVTSDLGDINKKSDEVADTFKDLGKGITSIDSKKLESLSQAMGEIAAEREDIEKITKSVSDMKTANLDFGGVQKSFDAIKKNSGSIFSDVATGFVSGTVAGKVMANTVGDVTAGLKDAIAALDLLGNNTSFANKVKAFDDFAENLNKARKRANELTDEINYLEDLIAEIEGYGNSDDIANIRELEEATSRLANKKKELAEIQKELNAAEDKEQSYTDEFYKKLDAYDKLCAAMQDYLNDLDKSEFAQKRVAQAYKELAEAMARMYDDIDTTTASNALDDLTESLKDVTKELKIDSTENLFEDLEKLGKSIEDKTDKLKEFKEVNRDISGDDEAKKLLAQANALREYADNAAYALKVIEEFDDGSQEVAIVGNKKALEDFLDPKKIKEYNEAINEYLHLMNETGGQISKRFLDDDGKFDVNKYIADYERFGKPIAQLTANFKALRQQVLEYLKVQDEIDDIKADMTVTKMYKEEAEAAQKAAKARVEAAQAALDAAKAENGLADEANNSLNVMTKLAKEVNELREAEQDLADAQKDVEKYTQELADAQKDLADAQERASKAEREGIADKAQAVKMINEQAEALRKLGAAVDGIELDEIRNIDKTLGTKLKNLFSDGLPKSFSEIGEYIKSAFSELNDLDFGNFGSLLKDAGMGLAKKIFGALPAEAKIAAAAIAAVTVALNKLYESGKQQFFSGLSNAAQKLQPIINAFQSLGREAITAFESITGTNVDLSSLMELGPNFEYQMQKVATIAGSNTRQLEELTRAAEHLGGTTMYSATQVGEAFEYMAMAGYSTEEMLSSIEGVLNLSIASGTDLAKTSDIVTDYMTALGMEASNTSEFVDKLAATVTSSNTTVELFGNSMKQVASQAGMLGVSMTDLSTAIGLQANAGVKGSKAGTALKNVLANLAAPTETQAEALKQLGLTADEAGSYLETTADGNVDLEATIKKITKATESMTKAQKTALIVTAMGKVAAPGILALLNQGTDAWDELSATIENSTGTVQYWNECMSLAGKSGDEATKTINNMKKIYSETESEAIGLGLSTKDLSHAIAILGDDGKVTTDNVRDLIDVIDSMNTATGKTEKQWRSLDKAGKAAVNTGYDYDATIAKIAADTSGLSQEKKELIKKQLDENMTLEEANAVLKEYGLSAERVSFSNMTYADKLQYLRDALGESLDNTEKATLKNLGLGDSIDEISEILAMSDDEFKAYTDNLETVKGMAEQMAKAMDEVTKASLLNLASAIENVCIAAFNKIKPALKGATDAVNEFFDTWHNGTANEFTWDGLEQGLSGLADKVRGQEENMQQAVIDLFDGVNRFINKGSLDSLLNMGTSVIQSICKGIIEAKDNGSLDEAIDGAIKKICNWIETNGPIIEEAGVIILDSLTDGIKNNEDIITSAMNKLCSIMTSWASSSGDLKAAAGLFAEQFVGFAVENMWIKFKSWIKEKFTAFGELFSGPFTSFGTGAMGLGMNLWNNIMEGIFGVDPAETAMSWLKEKFSGFHPIQAIKDWFTGEAYADSGEEGTLINGQPSNEKKSNSKKTTKKLEQVDVATLINIDEKELSEVESALVRLQTAAEEAANTVRKDFVSMANIARNQMLNISNIIRNQAINWANIIRNQAKNARDGFTSQMISMASVARTQLVNVSNIIRNQSLSWYNVINNQAKNARDAFTRQFMSMAAVARNQMANCLSAVNDYMSQIKTATSQQMTMNLKVNRAVTTTDVTKSAAQGLATTMSNIARSGASLIAPQAVAIGGNIVGGNGRTDNGLGNTNALQLSIPLTVDGREIARATASYNQEELSKMAKRNNRRRGE